jgi:hypothetical protein
MTVTPALASCRAALLVLVLTGCAALSDSIEAQTPPTSTTAASDPTDEDVLYFAGNLIFTAFHETGHMLVSEFDIPIAGREEDAVDNLATLLMIPEDDDPELEAMILYAVQGWFDAAADASEEEPAWWGEHGAAEQRAYQMLCLLAGSDQDAYAKTALDAGMPAERVESCVAEYNATKASWDKLLERHVAEDEQGARGMVRIVYAPASADLARAAAIMKEIELLEMMRDMLEEGFVLPRSVTVKAMECGEENAFWNPEDREIVMCYELASWFAERYQE